MAVSEADAEEAAKYLDTSSYSDEVLTDEVLAASLELGAIEGIEVGEAEEGESTLIVADDRSEEAVTMLRPVLSEAGVASYRELVTASLRECLALKTLNTPCGTDVTGLEKDGYVVVDGTATRTLTAEAEAALAGLTGEVTDRAVVSKYDTLTVDITFEGQNAVGQRGGFEVLWGSQMLSPKVDFAADDPKVVWE